MSIKIKAYHGTGNGSFNMFDTTPIFTTDDIHAATAYAFHSHIRHDHNPVLMTVEVELKNPKYISESELYDLIGMDDVIEWSDFDNLAYRLEIEGYDGVVLTGVSDFAGVVDGERFEKKYDQYVAFSNECVNIIKHERL